jgi:hypothetical protein
MTRCLRVAVGLKLLIGLAVLALFVAGCAASHPASQAGPTPGTVSPANLPASQTLTDQEIQNIIQKSGVRYIDLRIEELACSPRSGSNLGNGQSGWPTVGGQNTQSGYSMWRKYVRDHIRTNTAFGEDYTSVSVGALDISGWSDPTGEVCLNLRGIKDTEELQLIARADPAQIGQQLFGIFSQYDQSTRERAAQFLQ